MCQVRGGNSWLVISRKPQGFSCHFGPPPRIRFSLPLSLSPNLTCTFFLNFRQKEKHGILQHQPSPQNNSHGLRSTQPTGIPLISLHPTLVPRFFCMWVFVFFGTLVTGSTGLISNRESPQLGFSFSFPSWRNWRVSFCVFDFIPG